MLIEMGSEQKKKEPSQAHWNVQPDIASAPDLLPS